MVRTKERQFRDWIRGMTLWQGRPISRAGMIRRFVMDGLIPFLRANGYILACDDRHFQNCVATGLFDNQSKCHMESVWPDSTRPGDAAAEEDAHFHYVLDSAAWEGFWAVWGNWTEMDPAESFRGSDRRLDIQAFVWASIDLDASPQTETLLDILRGGDDEDDVSALSLLGRQGGDTYLQETVEYNGWAGYRK